MVIPVGGGLGPMGPVGPPPEEALRKLPFLKVTVLAVALVVVAVSYTHLTLPTKLEV